MIKYQLHNKEAVDRRPQYTHKNYRSTVQTAEPKKTVCIQQSKVEPNQDFERDHSPESESCRRIREQERHRRRARNHTSNITTTSPNTEIGMSERREPIVRKNANRKSQLVRS